MTHKVAPCDQVRLKAPWHEGVIPLMIVASESGPAQIGLTYNCGPFVLTESLERFVPHKIATLFGLIGAGAQFYSR